MPHVPCGGGVHDARGSPPIRAALFAGLTTIFDLGVDSKSASAHFKPLFASLSSSASASASMTNITGGGTSSNFSGEDTVGLGVAGGVGSGRNEVC